MPSPRGVHMDHTPSCSSCQQACQYYRVLAWKQRKPLHLYNAHNAAKPFSHNGACVKNRIRIQPRCPFACGCEPSHRVDACSTATQLIATCVVSSTNKHRPHPCIIESKGPAVWTIWISPTPAPQAPEPQRKMGLRTPSSSSVVHSEGRVKFPKSASTSRKISNFFICRALSIPTPKAHRIWTCPPPP